MANNYCQATVTPDLPLTDDQLEAITYRGWDLDAEEWPPEHLSSRTIRYLERLTGYDDECFTTGLEIAPGADGNVYLYASEYDGVADELLQDILRDLPQDKYPYIVIEGAYSCSKMRQGEFGGFAVLITREKIHRMDTGVWLNNKITDYKKVLDETTDSTEPVLGGLPP